MYAGANMGHPARGSFWSKCSPERWIGLGYLTISVSLMDVEVVVQLPLAYAVVVAFPFLGLHLDVVIGVVAAQGFTHHLVPRQRFDGRLKRSRKMADAARVQFFPGHLIQIVMAWHTWIDFLID